MKKFQISNCKLQIVVAALWAAFAFPADGQNVLISKAVPGAQKVASSHVTASTGAGTLVIARPTRTSCLVRNTDATISVYIGPATVSSSNGMLLKAGESFVITGQGLWQVIAVSGSPVIDVCDEYN